MIRAGLLFLLLFSACTFRSSPQEKAVMSYRKHSQQMPVNEKNFPVASFAKNKEAVWQLLDRATIQLAQGHSEESQRDYLAALEAIDFYRSTLIHEEAARLLINDSQTPYIPPFHEALLARFMAACACFQNDDPTNGAALLRQAETAESLERELGRAKTFNPLTNYLLAAAFEREGDASQAKLLYERIGQTKKSKKDATLICIVHNGLLPEKKSIIAPVSLVSMRLLEILLAAWNIEPAISSLSGVAVPVFPAAIDPPRPAIVCVDRQPLSCTLTYDLFDTAKKELEDQLPAIAARAAARQLIRRASVGYAYEKDPLIGRVTDIGMLVANIATTADTRMWRTLPQQIHLYRMELKAGVHTISCQDGKKTSFKIEAGDLLIAQLFRPHGHETLFLIPKSKVIP